MEYRAVAKNVKISPRKVRLVADAVRELSIQAALSELLVSRKRGALPLKKVIESAMANAVNSSAKKDGLKIKTINITEGIAYKRYHFAGRGRMRPYVKKTSHINVVLEDNMVTEPIKIQEKEIKKEVVKETKKGVKK